MDKQAATKINQSIDILCDYVKTGRSDNVPALLQSMAVLDNLKHSLKRDVIDKKEEKPETKPQPEPEKKESK